jgi:hypothetical protein
MLHCEFYLFQIEEDKSDDEWTEALLQAGQ